MTAVQIIVADRAVAEDIVQETFARAWLSWRKLWPDGFPIAWTHKVAVNLAIGWRRRAAREARALARLARGTPSETPGPDAAFPELRREVAALPPRQRAAVAMHYVLGLTMEEAAVALGCRPGTVKSLLFAARERLRARLGEQPASPVTKPVLGEELT